MSAENEAKFDALMDDADKLAADIARHERSDKAMGQSATGPFRPDLAEPGQSRSNDPAEREIAERAAFGVYLRRGMGGLNDEQRTIIQSRYQELAPEQRQLAEGTGSTGGYLVPQDFYSRLIDVQKWFGGMRQSRATVLSTSTGAALPFPTSSDVSNVGVIVGENTAIADNVDPSFAQSVLNAFTYTSKIVRVPLQLTQDSAFDLESYIARKLGERIGRATNAHFTTGTGGGTQPSGVVTGASVGVTAANGTSQVTGVAYDSLVDTVHSVDPAYRGNAQWMFHDKTLAILRKLKDSQQRPLYNDGIAGDYPATVLGYPYIVNNDAPQMAANAKSMIFGDMSAYFIRDVLGVTLIRLSERYAEYLQVAFLAFSRHDGALVDGGGGAIKLFVNAAS